MCCRRVPTRLGSAVSHSLWSGTGPLEPSVGIGLSSQHLQLMPSAGTLCSPVGDLHPALTLLSLLTPQQADGQPPAAYPAGRWL